MDGLDALVLARIQFAANMTFHILFPTISISLGWVLLFFKLRFVKTKQQHWMDAYQFWVKIFALTFALGVVSGITMSFQFGTNWPGYMEKVGNIAGPLLAYEVLTAFFLEATMLGVMLFGRERVSERMHTTATLLVAAGTTLSAFWILALNSWMHTPAGFVMIDGRAHVTSWLQVIFNPSFPYRFTHMMLASGLTVAFFVAGVSSYRWLRSERSAEVMAGLKTGIYLAAVLIPLQIVAGDFHGLNTLQYQPAKLAAMEGIWKTEKGVSAVLFALPDEKTRTNRYEIAIPKLASLYLTHHLDGEVKGLDDFVGKHPPVAPVFWGFRIMVGMGLLMLAVSWASAYQLAPWKKGPARADELARQGAGGDDLCRLGGADCGLVCHRDRAATVAGVRHIDSGRRGLQGDRAAHCADAGAVSDAVCVAHRGLCVGGVLPGAAQTGCKRVAGCCQRSAETGSLPCLISHRI